MRTLQSISGSLIALGGLALHASDDGAGAHAAVQGWPVLTSDVSRFRTYFLSPDVHAP